MNYNYYDMCPSPMCDFLEYLISIKGKSYRTVHEYYFDLRTFYKYLVIRYRLAKCENFDDIDIYLVDMNVLKKINLMDLHAFISYIDRERNNGNRTKARKIACIRSYFKYLCDIANVISTNPAANLETPKSSKRLPIHLSLDESKELLESIDGQNKERDFAIILIFLNCGVRLSELVSINLNSLKNDTLTVIGKGNKERTIYVNDACKVAIDEYLKVRPTPKVSNDNALFLSNRKTRISQRAVEHLVKKYLIEAGLSNNKYSPHKLRHTAATLMYQYGNVDIRALQEILGHESVSTTQIYTHIDKERLRQAVKSNPLSEFMAIDKDTNTNTEEQ